MLHRLEQFAGLLLSSDKAQGVELSFTGNYGL